MKKNFLRGLFAACLLISCTLSASAKVYFTEDFDYTVESQLVATETWMQHASTSANPILVTSGNLTHAGYCDAASGQQIQLGTASSSQKAFASFKNEERFLYSAGKSLYYSALINLQSAPTEKPAHFLCFAQSVSGDNIAFAEKSSPGDFALLSATQSSEGKYKLNISRNNTTAETATTELLYNTTYLVVVKYTFVEGTTNDIVSLYINPTSTHEPSSADASSSSSGSGSDITEQIEKNRGIQGITVRQGGTFSRNASAVTLDAIRVADTWADLFPVSGDGGDSGDSGEGGDTPDTTPTPTITLSSSALTFNQQLIFTTDELTETITISAQDLTDDISLTSSDEQVTVEPAKITKEAATAEGGAEVTITLKSKTMGEYNASISVTSTGADEKKIAVAWYANPSVEDIAGLRAAYAADPDSYAYGVRINKAVTITHIYTQNSTPMWAVQDESGAVFVSDADGLVEGTYEVGDQVAGLIGLPSDYKGLMTYTLAFDPAAASGHQEIEPLQLTLEEWQTNAAKYCSYLVRLSDVTFETSGESFAYGEEYAFTQAAYSSKISLFADSELIGEKLPTTADIVGIVRNPSGNLISPRTKADLISRDKDAGDASDLSQTTAAQLYATEGTLHLQAATETLLEVFTVAGQSILTETFAAGTHTITLDAGVYLVKANGAVQKLIVR